MRFLSVVPRDVGSLFGSGHFANGKLTTLSGPDAQSAAQLLVTDSRMAKCWATLGKVAKSSYSDQYGTWSQSFITTVVYQYVDAVWDKQRWVHMTGPEQEKWLHNFSATAAKFEELIMSGPWPLALLRAQFIRASDYEHEQDRLRALDEESNSRGDKPESDDHVDAMDDNFEIPFAQTPVLNLSEALNELVNEQIAMAKTLRQSLKKPRDAHAGRARFLQELTKWCMRACDARLQEVVATTAAVIFADEAIGVRLVQIHTRGL